MNKQPTIKGEKIQCDICGKWYKQVGSHIWNTHKITAKEYRKKYGYDTKKGQLPPNYKKLKAKQAIERGGYKNLKKGKKYWFKKGQKNIGTYERSEQTMERLKNIGNKHPKKKTLNCIKCKKVKLTNNQTKYCSKKCRQADYKIKYNKHKTKLFTK